ncbi:4541_t:CDS:2 [Funneliformis mosseae]|uniref:4541_t:CDS:1 n=1 Tax=Funneliformis mosseae TaxID=27381 RepID=A0A9N9AF43_FUNMO|nr:4541_t:CDS:2 [Funneliformis mosseae]
MSSRARSCPPGKKSTRKWSASGISILRLNKEMGSTNVKEDPELNTEFYKHLTIYYDKLVRGKSVADFGSSSFEIETLTYSVYSLIRQYERIPSAFSLEHHEAWYNVNLWGLLSTELMIQSIENYLMDGKIWTTFNIRQTHSTKFPYSSLSSSGSSRRAENRPDE